MAKKVAWCICSICLERFHADDDYKLRKVFESHYVSTPIGQQCMGEKQLAMTFRRADNAWVQK